MTPPSAPASAEASSAASPSAAEPARPRSDGPSPQGAAARRILAPGELTPAQREAVRRHFDAAVFPALTPLALDAGHPFPQLRADALSLAVSLQRPDGRRRRRTPARLLALVQIPAGLQRLIPVPSEGGQAWVLLETIVADRAGDLFPGHAVGETALFRVTRGRGGRGAAVRLELAAGASRQLEAALAAALRLDPRDVYRIHGHLPVAGVTVPSQSGHGTAMPP